MSSSFFNQDSPSRCTFVSPSTKSIEHLPFAYIAHMSVFLSPNQLPPPSARRPAFPTSTSGDLKVGRDSDDRAEQRRTRILSVSAVGDEPMEAQQEQCPLRGRATRRLAFPQRTRQRGREMRLKLDRLSLITCAAPYRAGQCFALTKCNSLESHTRCSIAIEHRPCPLLSFLADEADCETNDAVFAGRKVEGVDKVVCRRCIFVHVAKQEEYRCRKYEKIFLQ